MNNKAVLCKIMKFEKRETDKLKTEKKHARIIKSNFVGSRWLETNLN